MKTIELSDASKPLSDYAEALDDDILVLTSKKKPVAALVPLKHVDREALALSTNPEFRGIIEAARAEFRSGKRLSLEEMKWEVSK
jgi:antitoxin (DNA-binding transcriptional repressor) of toxin-antitoxin stability system